MKNLRSILFRLGALVFFWAFFKDLREIYKRTESFGPGWDARSVCAATDAFWKGINPYYVKNLVGTTLSYTYPPLTLDLFWPLCNWPIFYRDSFKYFCPALAILIFAFVSAHDWKRKHYDRALIKALFIVGGFAGFHWSYQTANIAIFEALLLAVALFCLYPEEPLEQPAIKQYIGACALGFSCFLKMINFPLIFALYLLPFHRKDKLKLIGAGFLAYGLPLAISIIAYQDLFSTYLQALSGKIPGQHSPATEGANPSLFFVAGHFLNIGRSLGFSVDAHYFILQAAGYGLMASLLAFFFVKRLAGLTSHPGNDRSFRAWLSRLDSFLLKNPRLSFYLTTIAILQMLISLPRVKPYAYFTLATLASLLVSELPFAGLLVSATFALVIPFWNLSSRIFGGFEQTVGTLVLWGMALYSLTRLGEEKRDDLLGRVPIPALRGLGLQSKQQNPDF